ncbi:MAG: tripartite tricarboxylate transporter substrate binding protein [Betaproteobacteria bacterium]|nr:tripartite tricarboxylate transporter substrate binding protein [Betaproteobacteria bacterium]
MNVLRCIATAALVVPLLAAAQSYPSRPIRLVVPYPAGGAVDIVARAIAPKWGESLGQPLIIDNRGGGTGMIGTDFVAKSAPDGHTLLLTAYPPHNVYPLFYRNVPFDSVKEFIPIGPVVTVPQALVVNAALGVNSVRDLIEYTKRNPGRTSYASSGVGTTAHVGGELFNKMAGTDMVHIVYKGGAPALNDVLGGQVQVGIVAFSNVIPHVRAGKLRLLGVLQARRARSAPDVPSVAEGGFPNFDVPELYFAVVGPAGMAPATVALLNAEMNKASASADARSRLEGAGFEVAANTPGEFAEIIAKHTVTYTRFVTDAGIKPQ